MAAGDAAAAERHAAESLRRNEQHGHREGVLGSLHVLGFARLSQGDVRSARTHFTRALRSAVAMHHAGACAESLDGLGLVASCQERLADAAALFAAADDVRARGRIRRTLLTGRLVESARAHVTEALDRTGLAQAERRATGLELPHLLELAMQAEQPA